VTACVEEDKHGRCIRTLRFELLLCVTGLIAAYIRDLTHEDMIVHAYPNTIASGLLFLVTRCSSGD
jgi:hypothetical protein